MAEKNLINLESEKSVMQFLQEPSIKIAEVLTGILVSEQKDWKLSAGKIVQSVLKGQLLTQLGREIKKYQEEGKIKEDYFATHKNQVSLYELLKFLDEDVPDEELFAAVKSIFFSGVNKDAGQYGEALAYEFLQTAKQLSGTEVLILKANYQLAQGKLSEAVTNPKEQLNGIQDRHSWRVIISKQMGYGNLASIVAKYEDHLEVLGLIAPRVDMDRARGQFQPTQSFRLTEVGYKFCEFITNYP